MYYKPKMLLHKHNHWLMLLPINKEQRKFVGNQWFTYLAAGKIAPEDVYKSGTPVNTKYNS